MTRHVLGVLGVIAASVLLVVSAMMNYRFGYTLGKTPSDGHIYGLASAAADCFKALVAVLLLRRLAQPDVVAGAGRCRGLDRGDRLRR